LALKNTSQKFSSIWFNDLLIVAFHFEKYFGVITIDFKQINIGDFNQPAFFAISDKI
jgi:hypothetical protein